MRPHVGSASEATKDNGACRKSDVMKEGGPVQPEGFVREESANSLELPWRSWATHRRQQVRNGLLPVNFNGSVPAALA